jgi:predicted negative regulator of RcsB-dependent stress response
MYGRLLTTVLSMSMLRLGGIQRWRTTSAIALILCSLTACIKWPNNHVSSGQPDRALFERAMSAVEQERFEVAKVTLQTLVNTYPDSEYASKAKLVLQDRRIANCGESWNSLRQCDDRRATEPTQ